MNKFLLLFFLLFFGAFSFAQTTAAVQWYKSFGGTSNDNGYYHQQTTDGGYILIGTTQSNDGDVSGNHGYDVWVVKTSATGNIQWQKCLGGVSYDAGNSIKQTIDGGYIVCGTTTSNNGDVSGYHAGNSFFDVNQPANDIWIVKLNTLGVIQWQKCLGGTDIDFSSDIYQTTDGGFIISGMTASNNGDVSGNHNPGSNYQSGGGESEWTFDAWVIKLNSSGAIQWQKCLGGAKFDQATRVKQTVDGGFIVSGFSYSNDGDITSNQGNRDVWLIKLNSSGIVQWQKCLGGAGSDQANDILLTNDGGYILCGYTTSNDGDVFGNNGFVDYWVVKCDSLGNILWQSCYGGSDDDRCNSIIQTNDGGYILAGVTKSTDNNIVSNSIPDAWLVKINNNGILQWQKCFGGNGSVNDIYYGIKSNDGGIVLCGRSNSTAYNDNSIASGNHGLVDMWLFKIFECDTTYSTLNVSSCTSYTTPLGHVLTSSGTYLEAIPNHLGCDSIITINFTKYNNTFPNNVLTYIDSCSLPYIWNGVSYNSYGTYSQILQTIHGCDSTVHLNLLQGYLPPTEICIVGLDNGNGKNKIVWEKQQTSTITGYNIYRENSQSVFDIIGYRLYSDSSVFLDLNSSPVQQAYRYKIKYIDTCGNEGLSSTTHKTVHLTINQGVGTTWNLIWTPYDGVSYSSYNIYRGTTATNMSLLTTVASNNTSYTDANAPIGNVYYQIEIVGPNCNPSKSSYNTSRSNISTNDSSLDLDKIENTKFSIYPNPANNFIHIDYDGNIEKVEIIDAKGTVVFVSKENKNEYALPNHLQTGYYIVKIYSENQIPSRKELFIQR